MVSGDQSVRKSFNTLTRLYSEGKPILQTSFNASIGVFKTSEACHFLAGHLEAMKYLSNLKLTLKEMIDYINIELIKIILYLEKNVDKPNKKQTKEFNTFFSLIETTYFLVMFLETFLSLEPRLKPSKPLQKYFQVNIPIEIQRDQLKLKWNLEERDFQFLENFEILVHGNKKSEYLPAFLLTIAIKGLMGFQGSTKIGSKSFYKQIFKNYKNIIEKKKLKLDPNNPVEFVEDWLVLVFEVLSLEQSNPKGFLDIVPQEKQLLFKLELFNLLDTFESLQLQFEKFRNFYILYQKASSVVLCQYTQIPQQVYKISGSRNLESVSISFVSRGFLEVDRVTHENQLKTIKGMLYNESFLIPEKLEIVDQLVFTSSDKEKLNLQREIIQHLLESCSPEEKWEILNSLGFDLQ